MRRPLLVLLAVLAIAASVFTACYFAAARMRAAAPVGTADELDWLRTEFRLNAAELARVRAVHNGYQPECAAMCVRIAEKNRELDSLLAASTNVTPAVEQKLAEVAALRAECQAQMLRHFHQVSALLPPEQGRRYLAEKLPGTDLPPGGALEATERAAAVRAAVNRLPDELRESLVLAEWEEKSVTETATILNLTPKAVETRLYRARKQLREQLARWLRN